MRQHLLLAGLATALLLSAAAGTEAACPTGEVEIIGRVVDFAPPPLPPDENPVACCDVSIVVQWGGGAHTEVVTTEPDGTFSACVPCPDPDATYVVTADAFCCGAAAQDAYQGCIDPTTGAPWIIDLGDMQCTDPAVTDRTSLSGSVVCRSGPLVQPVADCAILIEDRARGLSWFTRTDAAGDWQHCVNCDPRADPLYTVTAQCCSDDDLDGDGRPDNEQDVSVIGCPEEHEVDTFVCDPCPTPPCMVPRDVVVSGQVLCPGPLGTLPIPDCDVRVTIIDCFMGLEERIVRTDAEGRWSFCTTCPATEGCSFWIVESVPLCCGPGDGTSDQILGCPATVETSPALCSPDPAGDCRSGGGGPCATGENEVRGRVTCIDPATMREVGVADCPVRVEPFGCATAPFVVTTDADGFYTACIPCPDCFGVNVTATCCDVTGGQDISDCSRPTVIDLRCGTCPPDPNPCAPDGQEVHGKVTCTDPATGASEPVADCMVTLSCERGMGPTVRTFTDENGDYSACYPCDTCDLIAVVSDCCDVRATVDGLGCDRVRADLDCGSCDDVDIGPCPGEYAVRARGTIACEQGGDPTPLAGCTITLTGRDVTGAPVSTATAVSGGDGSYEACVPCGAAGLLLIDAEAACCGATSSTQIAPDGDCPDFADLDPLVCAECSPCPDGMTRIQGRVRGRGSGTIEGCEVRIAIETCMGGVEVFETVTDSEGKYRACVPCPCPGSFITVTALCCDATRVVEVDECSPVTPIPTLFCPR